jgi:hypothetical protein
MQRLGPPGWRLAARLTTLLCEIIILAKSKEAKTESNLAEFSEEGYDARRAVLPIIMMNE